ncbi:MAG TPA: hypothetical protein PKE69_27125, partial [Pyrinomonadaceae bacterium]|nr:hypothetical protein [Pyrinomonadaceae bacterium]
ATVPLYVKVHLEKTKTHSARSFYELEKTFEANDKAIQKAQAEHKELTGEELEPADYPTYFQPYYRLDQNVKYYLCWDAKEKASAFLPFEGTDKMFKSLSEYEAYITKQRTAASPAPETPQIETKEPKPETPPTAPKKGESK